MDEVNPFPLNGESKPKLRNENISPSELKRYLILLFGTYRIASQRVGISESRLHQIFMGYDVPKNPDVIKRYAFGWGVDLVVLVKIFGELEKGGENEP